MGSCTRPEAIAQMLDSTPEEAIRGQLAGGETVVEIHGQQTEAKRTAVALTDRRLVKFEEQFDEDVTEREFESILFTGPEVTGFEVNARKGEVADEAQQLFGVILAIVGALGILVAFQQATLGLLLIAIGVVGFLLYLAASDEVSGIEVTLEAEGETVEEMQLPYEAVELAREYGRQVAAAHGP